MINFKPDFLLQMLYFVTGLYFEIREARSQDPKSIQAFEKAMTYYKLSFQSPEIDLLDNKLFKSALKQLKGIPVPKEITIAYHRSIDRRLSKFYLDQRSIYVIMETCHDDAQIHHVLHSFVLNNVKLAMM